MPLENLFLKRFAVVVAVFAVSGLSLAAVADAGARRTSAVTYVTVIAGKPSEFRFKLSKQTVHHGKVVFKVKNEGTIPHTFKICSSPKGGLANKCVGKETKTLSPGRSAALAYTFRRAGRYEYLCTIAGHAIAGMKGILKVT